MGWLMAARGGTTLSPFTDRAASKGSGPERRRESHMSVFPSPGLGQSCYAICKQTQQLDRKRGKSSHIYHSLAYFGPPDLCAQWCCLFHCGMLGFFFSLCYSFCQCLLWPLFYFQQPFHPRISHFPGVSIHSVPTLGLKDSVWTSTSPILPCI